VRIHPSVANSDVANLSFSTWLDAQLCKWQSADLDNRLTDMGSRNVPRASYIQGGNLPEPSTAFTDYYGDGGGNVTTLNHTLYAADIKPNVTVGDVMDISRAVVCSEYIYFDE
jgi:tyrosinase